MRIVLPIACSRAQLVASVTTAVHALGEDLGQIVSDAYPELDEAALEDELREHLRDFKLHDLSGCVPVVLARPGRLMKRFPGTALFRRQLHAVRLVRNAYVHNDAAHLAGLPEAAVTDVDVLRSVAVTTGAPCLAELQALRDRVTALINGEVFDPSVVMAAQQQQIDELTRHKEELQARRSTSVELAEARALLVAAQHDAKSEQAAEDVRSHKATIALLTAKLAAAEERAQRPRPPALTRALPPMAELDRAVASLPAAQLPKPVSSQRSDAASTKRLVGIPWTGPSGAPMTLFRTRRDLYDPARQRWLVTDEPTLQPAVDHLLTVRPAGGRVWVTDDGDVVTLVNGERCFAGRLRDVTPAPRPGTPSREPATGPKYALHLDGDVTCKATKRKLSLVRPTTARQTGRRLLRGRPDGGQVQVGPDGTVRTVKDGATLFVGRVTPDEWFP